VPVSRKDQLSRILPQLDRHFADGDAFPADADRWREAKRRLIRALDGLDLARVELESSVRPPEEKMRVALLHVLFGLDEGAAK
jgi:hypothetical protein